MKYTNLLIILSFIAVIGMMIAFLENDKGLFLSNAIFVSVIVMHDLFAQMTSKNTKPQR